MDHIVDLLIEQETIEGDQFRQLVEKFQSKQDKVLVLQS
jgi:ATP-dependent Zn protease